MTSGAFRLAFVPGVMPAKWVRIWSERRPDLPLQLVPVSLIDSIASLKAAEADAAFVRLPVNDPELSVIPLWTEVSVVVLPKDHDLTAADELVPSDLADEFLIRSADDPLLWDEAPGKPSSLEPPHSAGDVMEWVASGVGVSVVPMSLARLHHRKDLVYVPIAQSPVSQIGLAWVSDRMSDDVDDMIGIVRGRTANSSRGRSREDAAAADAPSSGKKKAEKKPQRAASAEEKRLADKKAAAARKQASAAQSRRRTGSRRQQRPGK